MSNDLKVTLSLVDDFTRKLTGIENELGAFGKKLDYVNNIASKFGLGLGVGMGATAVIDGLKNLSETAKEYTQVNNQLKESLGYTSVELSESSELLSNKNLIEKKDIQTIQERLSLYTKDEAGIKTLTAAILDYAKATGKDLLTATQIVTRAIETEKGSIKGFPGHLDGAAESSERLAAITDILNSHFHGQAEAVRESKNLFDEIAFSANKLKEVLAISLFGKAPEKEQMRYSQALEFINKYAEASEFYRKEYEDEYKDDLALVQEYEKKIGDAKVDAQKKNQEDLSANAIKKLTLDPAYATNKEAIAARKKASEDAKKEAKNAAAEIEKDNVFADKQLRKEAEDDAKAKYEQEQTDHKLYMNLVKRESDDEYTALSSKIESQEKVWKENHIKMYDDQKKHNESLTNLAMSWGEAYGDAIGEGIGKGKDGMKIAMKGILSLTVDFLEKEVLAAIASNTLQNVATEGYYGLAIGALEAAGIAVVGTAAKAAINSFSVGTNNAPGGPAFVHKNESIYLPAGSQVKTVSQTRQITEQNNSGHTFNISFHDASGNLIDTIHTQLRSGTGNVDRFVGLLAQKIGAR